MSSNILLNFYIDRYIFCHLSVRNLSSLTFPLECCAIYLFLCFVFPTLLLKYCMVAATETFIVHWTIWLDWCESQRSTAFIISPQLFNGLLMMAHYRSKTERRIFIFRIDQHSFLIFLDNVCHLHLDCVYIQYRFYSLSMADSCKCYWTKTIPDSGAHTQSFFLHGIIIIQLMKKKWIEAHSE